MIPSILITFVVVAKVISSAFVIVTSVFLVPTLLLLQYFEQLDGVSADDLRYYSGSVALADYCPYIQVSVQAGTTFE